MSKILVAYPVDASAAILAVDLLNQDINNEVTLYVDKMVTVEFMEGTVSDLLNIKPEVKVINNSDDWTNYQYLVFGNLNVAPGMCDKAFAQSMKNVFEKHLEMNVDENVKIIFGQNFRGLIAMRELVKVRPDLKKNCAVVSSILFQGRKIAARGETPMETRGLPDIGNKIFFFNEEFRDKLAHMAGQWKWGQFQLTEAAALAEGIYSLQNQGNLSSIQFAGVFPQDADFQIHPDLEDFASPVFLDSDQDIDDREKSHEYLMYLKKIDAYFRSEYTASD